MIIPSIRDLFAFAKYGQALRSIIAQGFTGIHGWNIIRKAFPEGDSKLWSTLYNIGVYLYNHPINFFARNPKGRLKVSDATLTEPHPSVGPPAERFLAGVYMQVRDRITGETFTTGRYFRFDSIPTKAGLQAAVLNSLAASGKTSPVYSQAGILADLELLSVDLHTFSRYW